MKCIGRISYRNRYVRCRRHTYFILCKEHWKAYWKVLIGIATVFGTLVGVGPNWEYLANQFKTPHEKFVESEYITGLLLPYPLNNDDQFNIDLGMPVQISGYELIRGYEFISIPSIICVNPKTQDFNDAEVPMDLKLKVRNRMIVISLTIRDLKTGAIIAKLDDNEWVIKPKRITDYYDDTRTLEIIDDYGYLAFRIWLTNDNVIHIRGYFPGLYCSLILNDIGLTTISNDVENYAGKVEKEASQNVVKFCKKLPKR